MEEILRFIRFFKSAENSFLHGCCYWFAWILKERFNKRGWIVNIWHDPVPGHFVASFIANETGIPTEIEPEELYFFDVRGDVTNLYKEKWRSGRLEDMSVMPSIDPLHYSHLMRDSRDFIDPEK